MAAATSKSTYTTAPHNLSSISSQSHLNPMNANYGTSFASPTDSEFSVAFEDSNPVLDWDEKKVAEWLRSINAGQYIELFRNHHITGEVLVDLDVAVLKEMGIKKVGDRVRIGSQAKQFRHQEYRKKRRADPASAYEQPTPAAPVNSPRTTTRSSRAATITRADRRNGSESGYSTHPTPRTSSRPSSPAYLDDQRDIRPHRVAALNARENSAREQIPTYQPRESRDSIREPTSAVSARSVETPQTARFGGFTSKPPDIPLPTPYRTSSSNSLSVDTTAANYGMIPSDKPWLRVVYDNGRTALFSAEGLKTGEEIILKTLRKGQLNETHVKSYCFHILDGTDPNPSYCRRLSEADLLRICRDSSSKERERLMFRKIHAGEPEGEQLQTAANIAAQQARQDAVTARDNAVARSQAKVQKLTGENLPSISYPMSPASAAERERHLQEAALDLERPELEKPQPRPRQRRVKELHGARPPSELVVADWRTYFPEGEHSEIDKTMRMSMVRSRRLSRATSRLSTVSTYSVESSLAEAPPLPAISDQWLSGQNVLARPRPLSIVNRMNSVRSSYRDSVASSMLDVLDEESPVDNRNHGPSDEPNRKSYVSFGEDSTPDSATMSVIGPDGQTVQRGYFDDAGSGSTSFEGGGSLNEQLTKVLAEDGEPADEELNEFLKNDAWQDIKYIRGKLIGQGSFGSVYLALHAVTAELMAVKQVELPSTSGAVDTKKNNMVEALKREIALLRELKHPHIVQYLGSSSDSNHLNIFLEYIPGGSIAKMLVDYGSLNENLVANFVRQILVGLAFLHSKDIIHRDIKGANVLVDNHGAVKISDFGISKRVQDSKNLLAENTPQGATGKRSNAIAAHRVSLQGSVFWMAPEVVRQTAYTRKADIWSLGCLVVEMLTGNHPHPNMTQLQAIFKIGGKGAAGAANDPTPDIPPGTSREATEFLKKTFALEHEERPEASELLEMPFIKAK